jgi:hypothetical protein
MKRLLVTAVLPLSVLSVPVLGIHSAFASTPAVETGAFSYTSLTITSSRMADGNFFFTGIFTGPFTGALTGPVTQTITEVDHPTGRSNFSGMITCTCTVAGTAGTLIMRYEGTGTGPWVFGGQFVIISGTGGLAQLHGSGTFQSTVPLSGTYSISLHFDP